MRLILFAFLCTFFGNTHIELKVVVPQSLEIIVIIQVRSSSIPKSLDKTLVYKPCYKRKSKNDTGIQLEPKTKHNIKDMATSQKVAH